MRLIFSSITACISMGALIITSMRRSTMAPSGGRMRRVRSMLSAAGAWPCATRCPSTRFSARTGRSTCATTAPSMPAAVNRRERISFVST
jgi:hypothetical protein